VKSATWCPNADITRVAECESPKRSSATHAPCPRRAVATMSGIICMATKSPPAFHSMGSQAIERLMRRASPWCFHTAIANGTPRVITSATNQIHTVLAAKPVRSTAAARPIETAIHTAATRLASEPRPSSTHARAMSTDFTVDAAAPRPRTGRGVGRPRRGDRDDGSGAGAERGAAEVTNSDGSIVALLGMPRRGPGQRPRAAAW
jgi:hypothetical protein